MGDYFSRREGFTLPEGEQVDDLNQRTRSRLAFVLKKVQSNVRWDETADRFFDAVGALPVRVQMNSFDRLLNGDMILFNSLIENYLIKYSWNYILDLLEIVYADLPTKQIKGGFEKAVNTLFCEELIRWRMANGQFARIIDQVAVIKKAEEKIADPKFKKAHKHLKKSWAAFHQRPDPDITGCMRDAWDAVEIVALHCAGKKGGTFQDALAALIESGIILDDWKKTLDKFYGLACNWVRHPKPEPLPCKIEDAEMFLIFASQIIIYMVSRYKQIKQ